MYVHHSEGALDYFPCRYEKSKLLFRGPKASFEGPYVAVIGGSETYGKYVPYPYPDLLAERLSPDFVNLGCLNGGLDAFVQDDAIMDLCRKAEAVVIQTMGAQNLTNSFYMVHPRRNDRVVSIMPPLRRLYPGLELQEIAFTRHLLTVLKSRSENGFAAVVRELQTCWTARMQSLIAAVRKPVLILHATSAGGPVGRDPWFVTTQMVQELCGPCVTALVHETQPGSVRAGVSGKVFPAIEAHIAAEMPGPGFHDEIAERVAPVLGQILESR